jgi:hypothetical protein
MKSYLSLSRSHFYWLLALICSLFLSDTSHSQSLDFSFVNAAGFDDGPAGSLRWTIGEPVTLEVSGEQGSLRVGFLHVTFPEDIVSSTMSMDPYITISLTPNPARDEIRVQLPNDDPSMIRILSMDGQPFIAADITGEVSLDIRTLPAGQYLLYVLNLSGHYNTQSFIKL